VLDPAFERTRHHEQEEETVPKGYWIVRVDITDQEKYKAYIAANAEPLKKYDGRFLVRAGSTIDLVIIEGYEGPQPA
jgi:uncharacterized protein (DUF1330 family)